jgi:hypothetical protein
MKIMAFILVCLGAMFCSLSYGQNTNKTSEAWRQAVGGRWQSADGDTYEFDSRGYEHWIQILPVSHSAQAEGVDGSKRIEMSEGTFHVGGDMLVLTSKDGASITNTFLISKAAVGNSEGKFFESGYSLTITSNDGKAKRYDLMYW